MGTLADSIAQAKGRDDPYLEGVSAAGESMDGAKLGFFEFHDLELERCSLVGANLAKASLYDCTLRACDLSNANLTEAFLTRTRLVDCKLAGTVLTGAILRTCRLSGCHCRYLNAGEAKLENVSLTGCDLEEAFLSELRLRRGTRLRDCRLVRADLFRTPLKGVDLSTCDVSGIAVSDTRSELRGAIFSTDQAPELAALLGVRFKE